MTHTAKHTPGPWVVNADGRMIEAQLPNLRNEYEHICDLRGGIKGQINLGNAHLIAAAPAMYEALVMLLDNMHDKASVTAKWLIQRDTPVNEVIPYLSSHDEIAWYQIIRTALAQADGKQKVS